MVDTATLLDAIVRLRLAIPRVRDRELRSELRELEARLRRSLGAAVGKKLAAGLLGVSVTALDRWIDRGYLPAVAPAAGARRLAVESGPLLELATEVRRLRRSGRSGRVVAEAIRELGWRGRGERVVVSLDVARLPRPNVSVDELQRQFAETTADERVLQVAALSRSLALLQPGMPR